MTLRNQSKTESLLSPQEVEALRKARASGESARLSPQAAAQLFSLYLQGYSVSDLVKQNPNYGSLGLGLIVRARIEYNWDEEREKYIQSLMSSVRQTVEKVTLESIQFASDGMAVFHRLAGDRFKKYLQTGDVSTLGDFRDMSFKNYKDFVELLQKLTGQDIQKQKSEITVLQQPSERTVVAESIADRPIEASEAAVLLSLMADKGSE